MAVSYREEVNVGGGRDVIRSFRWSAIFAGLVAALATQILMTAIGIALGITAAATATEAVGVGAGIWMVLSPLVAMFVGGMVATYLARPLEKNVAMLHGVVVWGLALVIGAFMVGSAATTTFASLAGATTQAAGTAAAGGVGLSEQQRQELQQEFQQQRGQIGRQVSGEQAAEAGTWFAWATVLAMLLSLGTAILGAIAGQNSANKEVGPERGRGLGAGERGFKPEDRYVPPRRDIEERPPPDLH